MTPNSTQNGNIPLPNTSIPVYDILHRLASSTALTDITQYYPNLTPTDIKTALEYAASVMRRQTLNLEDDILQSPAYAASSTDDTGLDLNKVLAVDDVEQNRLLMKYMLTKFGFTPVLAANGEEAFEKACTEKPALIVSDVMMPGLSGLDLLAKLKADDRTKDIAVILVTAHYRNTQQVSQGLNMGANDYIQRPFSIEEFISRVNAVLRVKKAEATQKQQAQVIKERNRGLNLVNELALAVNSSPDVKNIFASSVQNLSQLLEAQAVSLVLFDDEKQQLTVNISTAHQQYISVVINADKLLLEQVPTTVLQIIQAHHQVLGLTTLPTVDAMKVVPVHSREWQTVGAIVIVNKQGQSFNNADWVLLHSAGNIIAVAIENARLLETTQQQVDDLIALNDIGRVLSSTLEIDRVFTLAAGHIQKLLHSETTSLWVWDNTQQKIQFIAASVEKSLFTTNPHFDFYSNVAEHIAQTGDSFLTADVSQETDLPLPVHDAIEPYPRSILGVPVRFENQVMGVILLCHPKNNQFNQNHLRLSYPIANSVGTAIKNAQLFAEVQEFNNYLEQMVETRTQQLAEEREKTETILANMADGLLILDAHNHILTANTAAETMLGVKLSEMLGAPLSPTWLETPLWQCINDIATRTAPTVTVTIDVPHPQSGQALSIEAHSAKVHGDEEQVIGTVIVLRDITTLKEVEQMKARFMAGVTHELKTPLAIIQLHAQNLAAYFNKMPPEKRGELLQAIQHQTQLLRQLVENILHLSRYDNGIIDIPQEPVSTAKIIDQVVTDLRPLAHTKQITLNWQKPAQEIMVLGSADHLERVIRNLIDNAIKYTPQNQTVAVELYTEQINKQPWAKIKVADTGVGISPHQQEQIFERFYRIDPSHTVPGTGLGLSIVKEIVNIHQGTIEVKSTPNKGSQFIVSLPAIS